MLDFFWTSLQVHSKHYPITLRDLAYHVAAFNARCAPTFTEQKRVATEKTTETDHRHVAKKEGQHWERKEATGTGGGGGYFGNLFDKDKVAADLEAQNKIQEARSALDLRFETVLEASMSREDAVVNILTDRSLEKKDDALSVYLANGSSLLEMHSVALSRFVPLGLKEFNAHYLDFLKYGHFLSPEAGIGDGETADDDVGVGGRAVLPSPPLTATNDAGGFVYSSDEKNRFVQNVHLMWVFDEDFSSAKNVSPFSSEYDNDGEEGSSEELHFYVVRVAEKKEEVENEERGEKQTIKRLEMVPMFRVIVRPLPSTKPAFSSSSGQQPGGIILSPQRAAAVQRQIRKYTVSAVLVPSKLYGRFQCEKMEIENASKYCCDRTQAYEEAARGVQYALPGTRGESAVHTFDPWDFQVKVWGAHILGNRQFLDPKQEDENGVHLNEYALSPANAINEIPVEAMMTTRPYPPGAFPSFCRYITSSRMTSHRLLILDPQLSFGGNNNNKSRGTEKPLVPPSRRRMLLNAWYDLGNEMETYLVNRQGDANGRKNNNNMGINTVGGHFLNPKQANSGKTSISSPHSCRVMLKDTRNGRNRTEVDFQSPSSSSFSTTQGDDAGVGGMGELLAFLPLDAECEARAVYKTLAEERLRLWILKALICAQVNRVHQLYFPIDLRMIVAQCIGLLEQKHEALRITNGKAAAVGAEAMPADHHLPPTTVDDAVASEPQSFNYETSSVSSNVALKAYKIIFKTIEDFVQHSGVIWRVVVGVDEVEDLSAAEFALELVREEKIHKEKTMYDRIYASYFDSLLTQKEKERKRRMILARRNEGGDQSSYGLSSRSPLPTALPPPVPENIIFSATVARVRITDDQMYEVFQALDTEKAGVLDGRELYRLFQYKENPPRPSSAFQVKRYGGTAAEKERIFQHKLQVLLPLDSCGIFHAWRELFTAEQRSKSPSSQQKNDHHGVNGKDAREALERTEQLAARKDEKSLEDFLNKYCNREGKMDYDHFSSMMLHLAKR